MKFRALWLAAAGLGIAGISAPALAVDIEPSFGLYYFTSNKVRTSAAQTESAEGGLKFQSARDPRVVAHDLAREELQRGNVCLTQAEQDLRAALKSHQILDLCKKIYKNDLAEVVRNASRQKLNPDYLRCSASIEAHEAGGSISMVLSFHGSVVMEDHIPSKLRKAGFTEDKKNWTLPEHEAKVGSAGADWKDVLKKGSCTVDEKTLNAFLDRYLDEAKVAKALARCRSFQVRDIERLTHMQKQFKEYVPDEWLKDVGGTETQSLLAPPLGVDTYSGLKECKEGRAATVTQLEKLKRVAEKIADRHDITALSPKSPAMNRSPASEDEEF